METVLNYSERNSELCTINTFSKLINKYGKKGKKKKVTGKKMKLEFIKAKSWPGVLVLRC